MYSPQNNPYLPTGKFEPYLQNLYIKSHEIIRYNQITFVQRDKNYKLLSIPPKCKI